MSNPNNPYGAPYGGQPYGTPPPYGYPPPARPTNGMAVASLIVSIATLLVTCGCLAPVGAILGHVAKKQIAQSNNTQAGDGMAMAGIIIGWIGTGLMILWVLIGVVLPLLGFGGLALFAGLGGLGSSGSSY